MALRRIFRALLRRPVWTVDVAVVELAMLPERSQVSIQAKLDTSLSQ